MTGTGAFESRFEILCTLHISADQSGWQTLPFRREFKLSALFIRPLRIIVFFLEMSNVPVVVLS
jgi:hypothetical protein